MDQTLANVQLLEWVYDRGAQASLLDEGNQVFFLDGGTLALPYLPAYRFLSFLPLDREAVGVTMEGVDYPVKDMTFTRGDTLGISNEVSGEQGRIAVRQGRALVVRSKKAI